MRQIVLLMLAAVLCLPAPGPARAETRALDGYRVAIDPGHQARLDDRVEPAAPGKTETKMRVAGCAIGIKSRKRESQVNLEVALLLRDYLESLGAQVLLVRDTEDITLSNVQRAQMANQFQADVFLRLHCNANDNRSQRGIRVYAQKRWAKTNFGAEEGQMLAWAEALADTLLLETSAPSAKGAVTDIYSGSNWALMPTFLIEMGYLTNAEDDALLQTDAYRDAIARGIAAFIGTLPLDAYRDHPVMNRPVMENMRSTAEDLIILDAPHDTAPIVRTVRKNYRVFVLDSLGGNWYLVQNYQDGGTGYIHCDTLEACR